jgi:hypothetical protein
MKKITSMNKDNEIKKIELFNKKENTIKSIPLDTAIFELYYLRYRIPTQEELDSLKLKTNVDEIKRDLSSNDLYIPLYDAFTFNIYIVQRRNVYIRVINHDYRFPDDLVMEAIKHSHEKKTNKLKKNPDLENDKVFMRSIRKAELMIEFMNQFDKTILHNTYVKVFFHYAPEIGNATYTCMRKSFIPHKGHLTPYYTRDEVIKLGMNMELIKIPAKMSYIDFKDSLTTNDYKEICSKIQENDVSADILIKHQNYIVNNDMVGLIQYYTIQGSYFMNQYMRGMTKYEYKNEYLEENIEKMWNLVLNAPPFDNDYIVYRFVSSDDYLKHLNKGDIFKDDGFTSTTRDPFYRNDLYKFGFILIKIKIPAKVKGIGLCLETLSHFPSEEEIILPPLTNLKLVSKDADCEYHHPDEEFVASIKTRYEFVWVSNDKIKFPKRTKLPPEYATNVLDFLAINKIRSITIKEKIDYLIRNYFDPMNRIKCKIGEKEFYVVAEWYDSTGPYEEMYSLKTSEGFSLYSIYKNYILFMIEIAEINDYSHMKINYFTKYSTLDREEIMGDDNFIRFISSVAYYFDIPNVVIYADFMSCDKGTMTKESTSKISRSKVKKLKNEISVVAAVAVEAAQRDTILKPENPESIKYEMYDYSIKNDRTNMDEHKQNHTREYPKYKMDRPVVFTKKQRTYMTVPGKPEKKSTNKKGKGTSTCSGDSIDEEEELIDVFTGGSYCLDFYKYFKNGERRYENTNTLNVELQPKFSYHDLDTLKTIQPLKILKKEDRDEIYQIYVKSYVLESSFENDNLADFYTWMIENKCYLMDIFIKKMDKIFRDDNPFRKGMYILDAMAYLYNRHYVNTYSRYIKMVIDEEHQLLTLPKNDYRIRR